jgi:L-fuconate dehydratase
VRSFSVAHDSLDTRLLTVLNPPTDRYVDHLHEHFTNPPTINSHGYYNVSIAADFRFSFRGQFRCANLSRLHTQVPTDPTEGYSIGMHEASKAAYVYPHGSYWVNDYPRERAAAIKAGIYAV